MINNITNHTLTTTSSNIVQFMDVSVDFVTTHAHVLLTSFNLFICLCLVLFVICYIKNPSYVVYKHTLSTVDNNPQRPEQYINNNIKDIKDIEHMANDTLIYPMIYNKLTTPFKQ
ncbi:protein ORF90 [Lake sturgeon herpesvirus]|nr:protein ORF90 [Lake sturgeon herpesvirus]